MTTHVCHAASHGQFAVLVELLHNYNSSIAITVLPKFIAAAVVLLGSNDLNPIMEELAQKCNSKSPLYRTYYYTRYTLPFLWKVFAYYPAVCWRKHLRLIQKSPYQLSTTWILVFVVNRNIVITMRQDANTWTTPSPIISSLMARMTMQYGVSL